ncbi:MAG: hypothetical protein IKP17_08575 [Oscillospiraceae bacterium]|jgi:hypothetical protein|nr:hypothetical protein [Oscillospiraceae bacterium]
MKFRNWMAQTMAGRYGTDPLNRALNIATLVFLVLSLFIGGSSVGGLIWVLAILSLVWSTFRTFSRNIGKRSAENEAYLRLTGRLRSRFGGAGDRFRQRKDYRFFRCPSCGTWLRVPRGKGKLSITCRQCGERFTRNT